MVADAIEHQLGFALRVQDHFTGDPIGEELDPQLDTGERVVRARGGGRRNDDGTYRWADLAGGLRLLALRSPSGHWTRFDPAPIDVVVPLADPMTAVIVEMWPTPLASAPPGVSAIRGKLVGSSVAGLRVEIAGQVMPPTGRFTLADADGELLYLLPGGPWPLTPAGALALEVSIPGRTVTSVELRTEAISFASAQFEIPPQREIRVRFHVT